MKPKYKLGERVIVIEHTQFGVRINWETIDEITIQDEFIFYNFEGWGNGSIVTQDDIFNSLEDAMPLIKELLEEDK